MSGELSFRAIHTAELPRFEHCTAIAFHAPTDVGLADRFAHRIELDRTRAAFDGGRIVGTAAALSHSLSVPGGELTSAGITWISVLPTHRRRGILGRMLDELLTDARARGEEVATLWASEGGIYGRFGFGPAATESSFAIDTRHDGAPWPLRPGAPDYTLQMRDPAGARPVLEPLFERARLQRPGMVSRTPEWWDERVLADHRGERGGGTDPRLVVAALANGSARGYAIYRVRGREPDATIVVSELIAPDDDAAGALWRYLCSIDLVGRVEAPHRPVDDPLPLLFPDLRRASVVEQRDSLWVRLLDLPRALEGRGWAADVRLTLAVQDERIPENAGSWLLDVAGHEARVTRAAPGTRPDLTLDVRWLGAAYLGGTPLTRLLAAGAVAQHTEGAAEGLDAALHVPLAPWVPEMF